MEFLGIDRVYNEYLYNCWLLLPHAWNSARKNFDCHLDNYNRADTFLDSSFHRIFVLPNRFGHSLVLPANLLLLAPPRLAAPSQRHRIEFGQHPVQRGLRLPNLGRDRFFGILDFFFPQRWFFLRPRRLNRLMGTLMKPIGPLYGIGLFLRG